MPYSYPPKYALKEDTRLISETIDALETHVGDYSNPKGTDIATDLAKVYGDIAKVYDDVETAETGLLARAAALEAVAPTTGAPVTARAAAKATYDTDKITFTAKDAGADGNNITVEASCRLSATLGSGTTEITLVGEAGLHSGSTPPLVWVQITQAATEAPLSITNTAGEITIELPADGDNNPVNVTMANLVLAIEAEMESSGELDGVVADVETGDGYDPAATATVTGAVAFTAAANTVTEDGDVVTIWLANDGTNFDNYDDVVTEVNLDVNSTLVTASAGVQDFAEPFEAISLTGGVDITAGAPGAIRYEADKIWISVGESTTSISNWKKIPLWAWSSYITGADLSTRIDKTISASPHAIVIIDEADADAVYMLDGISQTVVIVDNNEQEIELPASTGSGIEIRITNKCADSHGVLVSDSSGDVIGAEGGFQLAQYESCVLVDVLEGTWARF